MSKFLYTAKNITTAESVSGEVEAKDEHSLAQDLRNEGFLLTSAKQLKVESAVQIKFLDRFLSVPLKEKMVFARNLAVMISSGLVVPRAIKSLAVQTKNKQFKKILTEVYDDVQTGRTLSESLAKYPTVFSELFTNMVYVGEVSGNLESVLDILALQLEKEHDLRSKVRGAMTYPAVIVVAMIGIGILMLTYILPKITGVFQDMDVELPKTTMFIIGVSDFLRSNAILAIALAIGLGLGVRFLYATSKGKRFFHYIFLRLPIVGGIIVKVNAARFARIYSSLLKSGVSVVDSLTIVSKTLGNVYYRDVLTEAVEAIQKGTDLSKVIGAHERIFPILVAQIIEVGEETGKTDIVLERLAEFYEEEVNQITKNMSSIIEPVLMLVIGGGVGFFAVAMLQPMYSVLENIK